MRARFHQARKGISSLTRAEGIVILVILILISALGFGIVAV